MAVPPITTSVVSANGLDFSLLECGSGPLALCLHGFPDSAHGWRHLLPALAEAGFRAVAPFQRGYAPTAVPADGLYQSAVLGVDANALHEALGGDGESVVIGHDWGAPGAYAAANIEPARWRRVVGMAVPPGPAMALALAGNLEQLQRSWYFFFFQSPLADMIVPANDLAFIDMLWRDWSPGFDGAGDAARAKDCMRDPAHLAAALGYYRATLGAGPRDARLDALQPLTSEVPSQPTLYLHGADDGCIGRDVAESARDMHPGLDVRIVPGAGHFLQLEQPDVVNSHVVGWLAG